jgi:hypothetical protein
MRVPYNCDHGTEACRHYYENQAAFGLPGYAGSRNQRGHGFFSSLFRMAIPVLKRGAIGLSKHLLKTGANIVSDVEAGANLKDSARQRFGETGQEVLSSIRGQMGGGKRKRQHPTKKKKANIKRRKANTKTVRKKKVKRRVHKKRRHFLTAK